ncbi:MAG TPA: hypothetical protein P5548_03695 [Candidatus Moranbacteria bacterium]|nr:hypothetical protein [Candidatus Moranbacteria bacterium]HRZ33973.1 hypothetical protein [Candidatus Moranbacteria bacterium]
MEDEKKIEEQNSSAQMSNEEKCKCGVKCNCKGKICTIWQNNKTLIIVAIVLFIIIAGVFAFKNYREKVDIGPKMIKEKFQTFLNANTATGVKVEIKEVTKENGLYKLMVNVNGQEQPVYLTKDGNKLVSGSLISLDEIAKQNELAKKQSEENNKPIPKADKPVVDLFVMSFCPYGNKAEDTLKPVYDLLKNKVDFNFHYIVSVNGDTVESLHGEKEVVQNEREACVLKDYGKDKWFSFVSYVNAKCGSDGSCWEAGAKTLSLNSSKISSCVAAEGLGLMKSNEEASKGANATGSPTMKINGVSSKAIYKYGDPESYKQEICNSFNVAPAECSKKLAAVKGASTSDQTATQGGSCN